MSEGYLGSGGVGKTSARGQSVSPLCPLRTEGYVTNITIFLCKPSPPSSAYVPAKASSPFPAYGHTLTIPHDCGLSSAPRHSGYAYGASLIQVVKAYAISSMPKKHCQVCRHIGIGLPAPAFTLPHSTPHPQFSPLVPCVDLGGSRSFRYPLDSLNHHPVKPIAS